MTSNATRPVSSPLAGHSERTDRPALPLDDIFHLLQNSRRRRVVEYFLDEGGPVQLGELADWIAAAECDTAVEAVPSDARQRVYISLYQSHLPKLDEEDVLAYDEETNVIERGPNAAALEAPLQFERGEHDPTATGDSDRRDADAAHGWGPYYLGISLGGLLSLVGSWLLALPSSVLSVGVLNVVLLSLYSVTFAGHVLRPSAVR